MTNFGSIRLANLGYMYLMKDFVCELAYVSTEIPINLFIYIMKI